MKLIETDYAHEIGEVVTDIIYDLKQTKLSLTIAFGKTNVRAKVKEAIINSIENGEINFKNDFFAYTDETNQYDDLIPYFAEQVGVKRGDIVITELDESGFIGLNKAQDDFFTTIHEVDGIKTLGIKDILKADELIVIASGPKLAKMVSFILDSEEDPKIPATVLASFDNVTLIIDKPAGKMIKE